MWDPVWFVKIQFGNESVIHTAQSLKSAIKGGIMYGLGDHGFYVRYGLISGDRHGVQNEHRINLIHETVGLGTSRNGWQEPK